MLENEAIMNEADKRNSRFGEGPYFNFDVERGTGASGDLFESRGRLRKVSGPQRPKRLEIERANQRMNAGG